MNKEEFLDLLIENDKPFRFKHEKAKTLLKHIFELNKEKEFYKFLIEVLDYEDTLNDYLCDFCDINNCFPNEED